MLLRGQRRQIVFGAGPAAITAVVYNLAGNSLYVGVGTDIPTQVWVDYSDNQSFTSYITTQLNPTTGFSKSHNNYLYSLSYVTTYWFRVRAKTSAGLWTTSVFYSFDLGYPPISVAAGSSEVTAFTLPEATNEVFTVEITSGWAGATYETFEWTAPSGSSLSGGEYLVVYDQYGNTTAIWFYLQDTSAGSAPTVANTEIQCNINSYDSDSTIAAAVYSTATGSSVPGSWNNPSSGNTVTWSAPDSGNFSDAYATCGSMSVVDGSGGTGYTLPLFTCMSGGTSYYCWVNVDSNGSDPSLGGTSLQVSMSSYDAQYPSYIATAVKSFLDGTYGGSFSTMTNGATLTIQCLGGRNETDAMSAGATNVTVTTNGYGSTDWPTGSGNSCYLRFQHLGADYYWWLNVDNTGTDPAPGGTGYSIILSSSGENPATVASNISSTLASNGFSTSYDYYRTVTLYTTGDCTDASTPWGAMTIDVQTQGAWNIDPTTDNFYYPNHLYVTGVHVSLSAAGATYPGGLESVPDAYMIRIDNDNFKLAATYADAMSGTPIDITSRGDGINVAEYTTV